MHIAIQLSHLHAYTYRLVCAVCGCICWVCMFLEGTMFGMQNSQYVNLAKYSPADWLLRKQSVTPARTPVTTYKKQKPWV